MTRTIGNNLAKIAGRLDVDFESMTPEERANYDKILAVCYHWRAATGCFLPTEADRQRRRAYLDRKAEVERAGRKRL
jgi:hypothetical protein